MTLVGGVLLEKRGKYSTIKSFGKRFILPLKVMINSEMDPADLVPKSSAVEYRYPIDFTVGTTVE